VGTINELIKKSEISFSRTKNRKCREAEGYEMKSMGTKDNRPLGQGVFGGKTTRYSGTKGM
jgi:hypothetical protein